MLEPSASPTLIQSLQRGMHLLGAVTEHGPLTARALSEKTGIVLPTTYHLLRTLVHEGYLRRSTAGQYALGDQLASVTHLESRARSLRLVREEMFELAQESRASVSIGVLRGADILISQLVVHPCTPRFECWPGMTIPGHATAIGKNILSRMDAEQRTDYVARHPLEELTSQTITATWRLEKELTVSALAHSDQEFHYGISCAAATLKDVSTAAALGAAYAFTRAYRLRDRIDEMLTGAAERISEIIRIAGPYESNDQLDGPLSNTAPI
jgi:DNA-binding IclR family transcriptional regulator